MVVVGDLEDGMGDVGSRAPTQAIDRGPDGTGRARPDHQGICLWLTGVSGSGKSTLTRALLPQLYARGRTVTVLDVVPVLAKQPGERTSEGKLLRKAFVAGEIAKHGGIAVCVTVSAGRQVREAAREMVGAERFVEIFVDVPAAVAAQRRAARGRRVAWRKRLRALVRRVRARSSRRSEVAYEAPSAPDVRIDTAVQSADEGAAAVMQVLIERGVLLPLRDGESVPDPLGGTDA
jgi:sulfate adenylyltransferase